MKPIAMKKAKGFAAKPVSRKERRKQERKNKKAQKHAFLLKQVGKLPTETAKPVPEQKAPKASPGVAVKKKAVSFNIMNEERRADRRTEQKLKADYEGIRRRNLFHDNKAEDKEIRRLEKKLHLNKRKKKSLPESFKAAGLDYLLDVCDPEKIKDIGQSGALEDSGSEFEEDFRALAGEEEDEERPVEKSSMKGKQSVSKTASESGGSECDDDEGEEGSSDADDGTAGVDGDEEARNIDWSSDSEVQESEDDDGDDVEQPPPKKLRQEKSPLPKKVPASEQPSEDDDDGSVTDEDSRSVADESGEEDVEGSAMGSDEDDQGDEDGTSVSGSSRDEAGVWEDIYGRTRDARGNVLSANESGKYVPPALRAEHGDGSSSAAFLRLKRQLNGLLNRLSETNVASIEKEVAGLFAGHSRNEMNRALNSLLMDSLVAEAQTPEKLLMEPALLVGILHVDVGSEVGAHFVETLVRKFDEIHSCGEELRIEDRRLDNVVVLLSHLHNFRVIHSSLIFDVLKRLCEKFSEKDVELILVVLRTVGFSLRKQDPIAMKDFIVSVKEKANERSGKDAGPRVKFMLEALLAVKNNNALKMPNYDPEPLIRLQKTMRMLTQGKTSDELKITMQDLLEAEKRGKWWVVGSAWTGKLPGEDPSGAAKSTRTSRASLPQIAASQEILELARKQRMNTEIRKNIFCVIMTSDDFLDAFEKLLKLGLSKHQDRELVVVCMDCCLQEKTFNPFYAHLVHRLCEYDRRFQLATQFSFWDRIKAVGDLDAWQLRNLAKFLALLFLKQGLPISVLKVIQFADLDKKTVRLVRQILMSVLLTDSFDEDAVRDVFARAAASAKLSELRDSLKLFMHHFLLKNKSKLSEDQCRLLEERVALAEKALMSGQKKLAL